MCCLSMCVALLRSAAFGQEPRGRLLYLFISIPTGMQAISTYVSGVMYKIASCCASVLLPWFQNQILPTYLRAIRYANTSVGGLGPNPRVRVRVRRLVFTSEYLNALCT